MLSDPSYYSLNVGNDLYLYYPNEYNYGGSKSGIAFADYESNAYGSRVEALTYAGSGFGSTSKAWGTLTFNIKTNGTSSDSAVAKLVTKKDIVGYFFQEHANVFPSNGSSSATWSVIIYDWQYSDGAPRVLDSKEFVANKTLGTTYVNELDKSTSSSNYTFKGDSYYTIIFKLESESDSQGIAHTQSIFAPYSNDDQYAYLDYIKIDF